MRLLATSSFLAVSLFLSGCQAASLPTAPNNEPPTDGDASAEVMPEGDVLPADPAPDTQSSEPTIALVPCSDGTRQAIEATVVGQVDAFSAGDFESAYQFASPDFQEGMPLEVFGTLIRINYPQLLEASNARSGPCDADEDNGVSTILMRFDTPSEPGYTLRYLLEYVGDQWRISGASREEIPDTVA
jgi:hypothetical protein